MVSFKKLRVTLFCCAVICIRSVASLPTLVNESSAQITTSLNIDSLNSTAHNGTILSSGVIDQNSSSMENSSTFFGILPHFPLNLSNVSGNSSTVLLNSTTSFSNNTITGNVTSSGNGFLGENSASNDSVDNSVEGSSVNKMRNQKKQYVLSFTVTDLENAIAKVFHKLGIDIKQYHPVKNRRQESGPNNNSTYQESELNSITLNKTENFNGTNLLLDSNELAVENNTAIALNRVETIVQNSTNFTVNSTNDVSEIMNSTQIKSMVFNTTSPLALPEFVNPTSKMDSNEDLRNSTAIGNNSAAITPDPNSTITNPEIVVSLSNTTLDYSNNTAYPGVDVKNSTVQIFNLNNSATAFVNTKNFDEGNLNSSEVVNNQNNTDSQGSGNEEDADSDKENNEPIFKGHSNISFKTLDSSSSVQIIGNSSEENFVPVEMDNSTDVHEASIAESIDGLNSTGSLQKGAGSDFKTIFNATFVDESDMWVARETCRNNSFTICYTERSANVKNNVSLVLTPLREVVADPTNQTRLQQRMFTIGQVYRDVEIANGTSNWRLSARFTLPAPQEILAQANLVLSGSQGNVLVINLLGSSASKNNADRENFETNGLEDAQPIIRVDAGMNLKTGKLWIRRVLGNSNIIQQWTIISDRPVSRMRMVFGVSLNAVASQIKELHTSWLGMSEKRCSSCDKNEIVSYDPEELTPDRQQEASKWSFEIQSFLVEAN